MTQIIKIFVNIRCASSDLSRNNREWVFLFPLLPTLMQSISISSHSIANDVIYSHSHPFPMTEFPFLPIPIPSSFVAKKQMHDINKIKIMQFRTQTAKQLKRIKSRKTFVV